MEKKSKSPFMVFKQFMNPLQCELLSEKLTLSTPDVNTEGKALSRKFENVDALYSAISKPLGKVLPAIQNHYGLSIVTSPLVITGEWYPQSYNDNVMVCDNSEYLRKKWVKVRNNDLTCILFLNQYQQTPPIDDRYEVYGGKVEFPQHGFGLNPELGTMVVYPSAPHFINFITPVNIGDLHIVRIHLTSNPMFLYQPSDFPGDFTTWFKSE